MPRLRLDRSNIL